MGWIGAKRLQRWKNHGANLSITNPNIYFMENENEVTIEDFMSLEEIEDAYIELMEEYKKLSKNFVS